MSTSTLHPRPALVLLAVFLAAFCGVAAAQEALRTTASLQTPPGVEGGAPGEVRLSNEYIAITVNATGENTGRFSVETTGGDPDRSSDDESPLIYKVPGQSPWTSYTTIRIDGVDYVFGGRPTERAGRAGRFGEQVLPPQLVDDSRIDTVYQIGPVRALQSLSIIRSSTTGLLDTVRIEYVLENTSDRTVNVGLRIMLDTMLGENDGAPFRVGELAIVSDTRFEGDAIPEFWQAFDSLSDPRVMSQGTLRGRDVTVPDSVAFSNWGALADGLWEFNFEPGRDFTRLGEFELDSATAMYWNPRPLAPGERRSYVVHYGLGGISISPGELSIGVTSPASVSAHPERPVTFPVVAYIQNTGLGEARQVVARLRLPPGLALAPGQSMVRSLGNLPPGRMAQVTWEVAVNPGVGGEFRYTVEVEAINAESNRVSRLVNIVAPAQLAITLAERNGRLRIENDRWTPLPYQIRATVTNTGGADADNVVVRFESQQNMLEVVEGDVAVKPLGRLAPGESVDVIWHVRPGTVPAQPWPWFGNLAYAVKGVIDAASEEYRADGFIDVPVLASRLSLRQEGSPAGPGEYVRVKVEAQNLRRFHRAAIAVQYDPTALRFVGADPGRIFTGPTTPGGDPVWLAWDEPRVVRESETSARVLVSGSREGAVEPVLYWASDTVATLHFKVERPGRHTVSIVEAVVYDLDGQTVQFERQSFETIAVGESE